MNNYSGNETINADTGKELTIKELTELEDGIKLAYEDFLNNPMRLER